MAETAQSFEIPELGLTVTISAAVLDSMRREAIAGLQKVPKRGLEIGGALFGTREGGRLRIEQWREIRCEHANGPGFDLSDADTRELTRLIEEAREDPELGALEALGWFCTRTRDELGLGEADRALHDRFFPQPHQFALVLRPYLYEPSRGGLFFRTREGRLAEEPLARFSLENPRRPADAGFDPAQPPRRPVDKSPLPWAPRDRAGAPPVEAVREMAEPAAHPAATFAAPVPVPYPDRQPLFQFKLSRRSAVWAALGLAGAAGAILLLLPGLVDGPSRSLNLRVEDLSGQLLIRWNPAAEAIEKTIAGSLSVREAGTERIISLSPEDLRSGSVTYEHAAGDVELQLTLRREAGAPVTEIARFVGQVQPAEPARDPAEAAAVERLTTELESLRAKLAEEERRTSGLRLAVETERQRILGRVR